MKRPDNASCCPGKNDKVKVGTKSEQKYILCDTLKNLHRKFLQENSSTQICFALFCKLRPKFIRPVSYAARRVCLCQKHQNMALKLKALRNMKLNTLPLRPDDLKDIDLQEANQKLQNINQERVTWQEWQKTQVPYKETYIHKTALQEDTEPKDKFIQKFLDEMIEFKMHAERVTEQYEQMRLLKQTLPASHVTVQVDFAENYVCSYADEVQSAYYSKEQVTIHPSVVHFNKANPEEASSSLSHKSFVIVSDETSHTSGTIFAMIKELVPKIKELVPSLETIHYLSDSPTSQYRNANMFNITSLHKQLFDVSATWQYFESGHGWGWGCYKEKCGSRR